MLRLRLHLVSIERKWNCSVPKFTVLLCADAEPKMTWLRLNSKSEMQTFGRSQLPTEMTDDAMSSDGAASDRHSAMEFAEKLQTQMPNANRNGFFQSRKFGGAAERAAVQRTNNPSIRSHSSSTEMV